MTGKDKKYVVQGMKAKCSMGTAMCSLNTDVGHGMTYQGKPILNANDHMPLVNMTTFGMCGNKPCVLSAPLAWRLCNDEHMIDGAPALTTDSVCPCALGGVISIVETLKGGGADNVSEKKENDSDKIESKKTDLEKKAENFCKSYAPIIYQLTPKIEVQIAPWLKGYLGKPNGIDLENGNIVVYSSEERNKLKKVNNFIDWYSYEEQTGKNAYAEPYLNGQEFQASEKGVLTNQDGYYWVTLGPRVLDSEYSNDGTCNIDDFKEYVGCRVDVVLQSLKDKNQYVRIECLWSGNIKAHTYKENDQKNSGIFQTGHPYPKSSVAKTEPYKAEYADGSIVEFTGKNPGDNGEMSQYVVAYLVVYPKPSDPVRPPMLP